MNDLEKVSEVMSPPLMHNFFNALLHFPIFFSTIHGKNLIKIHVLQLSCSTDKYIKKFIYVWLDRPFKNHGYN